MIKDIAVLERVQKAATNPVPCLKKYNYERETKKTWNPIVTTKKRKRRYDRDLQDSV